MTPRRSTDRRRLRADDSRPRLRRPSTGHLGRRETGRLRRGQRGPALETHGKEARYPMGIDCSGEIVTFQRWQTMVSDRLRSALGSDHRQPSAFAARRGSTRRFQTVTIAREQGVPSTSTHGVLRVQAVPVGRGLAFTPDGRGCLADNESHHATSDGRPRAAASHPAARA